MRLVIDFWLAACGVAWVTACGTAVVYARLRDRHERDEAKSYVPFDE